MQRPEEARALIAEARKAGATAQADEAEALLLEREQPDAACELYARAAAAGSDSFWTYYRVAAARIPEVTATDDFAQVASWLTRATTLNPASTPAFSMLASVQARLGRLEEGIAAASRAVELDRANVMHHVQLARLLASANRAAEAADAARRAPPYAATPQERTMLEQLAGS